MSEKQPVAVTRFKIGLSVENWKKIRVPRRSFARNFAPRALPDARAPRLWRGANRTTLVCDEFGGVHAARRSLGTVPTRRDLHDARGPRSGRRARRMTLVGPEFPANRSPRASRTTEKIKSQTCRAGSTSHFKHQMNLSAEGRWNRPDTTGATARFSRRETPAPASGMDDFAKQLRTLASLYPTAPSTCKNETPSGLNGSPVRCT